MKQAGYQTALIGKWHLGLTEEHWPNNRGFDHFHGWLGDMMDDYYKHERHGIGYMRLNEKKILPTGHATDLFTEGHAIISTTQNPLRNRSSFSWHITPHTHPFNHLRNGSKS